MVTRLWLIVLSLISNILALALPLALIQVYDRILANQAVGTAIVIFSAVALAIVLDGLVKYARSSILGRLAAQAEYELSLRTAEKLLSIDPRKRADFGPGRIRELFTAINRSNDVLIGQSMLALFDAPFAIAFLVLVWFLGGPTVFGPLAVLLVFGVFALFSAYRQARAGMKLFEASADEATLLMSRREHIDRIIADGELGDFAGSLRLHEKRKAVAQEISESNLAASLNLSQTGGLATTVLVLGVGSLVVLSGDMTTGGLAACLILGQRGVAGLLGLLTALARHQVSASAFSSIQTLLALPSVTSLRTTASHGQETIGLGFEVDGNRLECVPGSSLVIRSSDHQHGSSVFRSLVLALEGCETDRSAFLKDVQVFTADGKPMAASQFRVSICDADLTVFNGTLLENMTAFDTEATGRAVWLSEQIGLADAIGRLRDGLETRLAPGLGVPLSDGHLKRLMLVRALSGDPHLLLLRNPSLFLDARGVDQLSGLLKALEGKVTIVMFDEDDGLARNFDAIADLPSLPKQKREAAE
ncbi:ABC transporter transmembrane domain-containing protein [Roseibium suaedae]|uniref:ABC-type bacteriocin/lantibiotic exporter, contains an N-terminal double-glycine peptidase domain n=1 Tax=Roseibium suaedae TaxID=735517 RepID=A0A1M7L6Q4_9HYPH|nr:ABC transporter transmembrane domain-containing protein [Roseibium suaedae]SHM73810.1 ABC-type bacteriocin/lantibiotic exporter, contains an N-terminal double-glycine peptidase domain [Roseibium suaedae]